MANLKNVEVIKVGKWSASTGKVDVTSAMLDDIVNSFSTLNSVPGYGVAVKLGHKTAVGQEALGWMSEIARVGDTLVADFADVPPAIVDAVRERRYNSVSVEVYPRVEYDGKVFSNVLGGVALLGAEWPAVKGLKPLSASLFAEVGDKIEMTFEENEAVNFTQEQHDAILASEVKKAVDAEKATMAKTLSDAAKALSDAETARDLAQATIKTLTADNDKNAVDALIKAAEDAGQITPAMKPLVIKLAETVREAVEPTKRADAFKAFSDFIKELPKKVAFGEKLAAKKGDDVVSGQKVADQIDTKAKAFLTADTTGKLDYEGAVQKVYAAEPDLKTAYAQEM